MFFLFKQKPGYEMRISDGSSDVCSSDRAAVITERVDPETLALIDKLVAAQGRSRAWFVAKAVQRAAEAEADFLAFVQEGIDAADRGELIPHEEVFREIHERRKQRHNT